MGEETDPFSSFSETAETEGSSDPHDEVEKDTFFETANNFAHGSGAYGSDFTP
jgi:hypothetical protein